MAELPSMDDIFKQGRARERRMELFLGSVLVLAGLAVTLGMSSLTDGGYRLPSFGAVGVGVVLLGRGLFRRA